MRSSLIPYTVPSVKPKTSSSIEIIFKQKTIPPQDMSLTLSDDTYHLLYLAINQSHLIRQVKNLP